MLVLIEKQKGNQVVEYPLDPSVIITAEPGAIYTIKDTETGAPPEDLVLKKKGETLEVEVDGETVAQVEEFFAAESDTLFSADGSEAPPDDMAVAGDLAVPEDVDSGVLVVWEAGDPGMSAGWIAGLTAAGGIGLAVAADSRGGGGKSTVIDTTAPTVTITDDTPGTATDDVTYTFTFSEAVTGFTADDVDVTGGSKGDFTAVSGTVYTLVVKPDAGSTTDITVDVAANVATDAADNGNIAAAQSVQAVDTSSYFITINAAAGTFTSTLRVELYDQSGNLIVETDHDFSTGSFSYQITNGYTGIVFAKVSDLNTENDYTDETTGTMKNLGTALRAMALTDGEGNVSLTVSPLTELAVQLAGIDEDNLNLTADDLAFNEKVGNLFDVDDINGPVTTVTEENYDSSDGLEASEQYGNVLAMLSGVDENTGSVEETIEQIKSTIVEIQDSEDSELGLTQDGVELLQQGIDNYTTGESGNTANLSDLLLKPPVIDAARGGGITAQEKDAGVVVALSDVSEGDTVTVYWSGQTYQETITAAHINTDDQVEITIPSFVIEAAGDAETLAVRYSVNGGDKSPAVIIRVDTHVPEIQSVSIPDTAMSVGDTVTATITVDSDTDTYTSITGTIDGFALSNLTKVSDTEYTAQFTITDGGTDVADTTDISVDITITDTAGNVSSTYTTDISQNSDPIDANRPTLDSVTPGDGATGVAVDANLILTFSEAVYQGSIGNLTIKLTSDDSEFEVISITDPRITGWGTTTLTVNPGGSFAEDTGYYVVFDDNSILDAGGSPTSPITDKTEWNFATPDNTPPTVAITDNTDGTATGDVTYTFTFSEPVTGFTADDVDVTGGSKGDFTAVSDTVYTLVVAPDADSTTDITVDVAADVATDGAGNSNTAATQSVQAVDTEAPTVAITDNTAGTATGDVTYTFTFSEAVTGFTADDVDVTGGSKGIFTAVSDTVYTLVVAPDADSTTDITVDVAADVATDGAGNSNTAATQSVQAVDTEAPTVAITDNTAGTATGDVTYTFTFSEAVTGFTADDVDVTGGSKGIFTAVSDTVYTLVVAPDADSTTDITVDVAADVAVDGAGNSNTAATQSVQAIDTSAPVIANVTILDTAMSVGDTVTATITVNSDTDTYTIINGTIGGFALSNLTKVDDTTYEAEFTVTQGGADVVAGNDIPVDITITDTAGNTGTAYTTAISQGSDSIDANAPVITAVTIDNSPMNVGDTVTATITVDSDTDTYTTINGTIGGFTLSNLSKTNATTYTAQFTITDGGMDVAADCFIPVSFTVEDSAGNVSNTYDTDISQGSDSIDANRPTLESVTPLDDSTGVDSTPTLTLTFSEEVYQGTGDLTIKKTSGDSEVQVIPMTNITGWGGTTLTVGPLNALDDDTSYYVVFDDNAILDVNGSPVAELSDKTVWNFSTPDNTAPLVSSFTSTESDGSYKEGDTIGIVATMNEDIQSGGQMTVTLDSGETVTLTAAADGTTLTGTYTVQAGNNSGDLTVSSFTAGTVRDLAGNALTDTTPPTTNIDDGSAIVIDTTAPTVTDGNISISGASGTAGAFKAGDTVTVEWDNTGAGDNNSDISGVTVNFSAFGGEEAVVATNSGETWSASYTIVAGSIENSNLNVSVTATDDADNRTTTADTTGATVDSTPPAVTDDNISITSTGSGTDGIYIVGDTVTVTWNNTETGDNNSDISGVTVNFSAFGGEEAVVATNSGETWSASYTIIAGSIENSNLNVSVTATDDASNLTTTADTSNLTVDNIKPTIASLAVSGDDSVNSSDTLTAVAFSGTTTGVENDQTITVKIGGVSTDVTVTSNAFSGTADLSGVADSGPVAVTADVSDAHCWSR